LEDQDVRAAGAREVLAVDPGNTTANMILIEGAITTWDSASAERLLEQALAASPRVHNLAAPGHHLYTGMGRLDEALAIARRGVRADPLWWSQTMFLGRSLLNLGRAAEAIEPLERSLALRRSGYMAILPLALAYWREGRQDEALATMLAGFPEHEALIQGSWASGEWTGMNLALANNLDRPMAAIGGTYLDDQLKCRLYAVAGAEAEVYRWLEQLLEDTRVVATRDREAFRKVSFLSEAVKSDAAYDHYRHQRRFREISAEIDGRMAAAAGTYELARA
jgi:tetratricopeptide (TPR) repeat protein